MKLKSILIVLLTVAGLAVSAHGQLVFFNFDDASGDTDTDTAAKTADTVASNITVSMLATESSFNSALTATFSDPPAIQVSGASAFFQQTSQGAAGDAVYFTITAASGYEFSITQVSFDARGTSTSPADVGFSMNTTSYDKSGSFSNNSIQTTITESSLGFSNLTSATIAIQGWNASLGDTGALQLDDIGVFGSVSVIPEPSTYGAIGGLLALGMVLYRRRN